jgi:hypothetical protein
MGRPTGVTVIAVLYFLGTGICLLVGIGVIAGGGMFAELIKNSGGENSGLGAGVMAAVGAVLGIFLLAFGVLDLIVGIGLVKLKNWARIIALVLSGLDVLLALPGLALALLHFNLITLMFRLVLVAINGWIIWYLIQPNVTAAFQGRTTAASA